MDVDSYIHIDQLRLAVTKQHAIIKSQQAQIDWMLKCVEKHHEVATREKSKNLRWAVYSVGITILAWALWFGH